MGSKKIYHLEAWVVKVMRLYKVGTSFFAHKVRFLMLVSSNSSTILICQNLIDLV